MEIVKFMDGTFGIRRRFMGVFWYEYRSLGENCCNYWWSMGDSHFYLCKGTLEQAERELQLMNDAGTPHKETI